MGPNLLREVFALLLPFLLNPVTIVADIHQTLLQLLLDEKDSDLTSVFLYRMTRDNGEDYNITDEVSCYRFTRLPFGLTCSPFLLSATLRELPTMHPARFHIAASLVDSCTFIDDFAESAEDSNGAITIYYQLTAFMRQIILPKGVMGLPPQNR